MNLFPWRVTNKLEQAQLKLVEDILAVVKLDHENAKQCREELLKIEEQHSAKMGEECIAYKAHREWAKTAQAKADAILIEIRDLLKNK